MTKLTFVYLVSFLLQLVTLTLSAEDTGTTVKQVGNEVGKVIDHGLGDLNGGDKGPNSIGNAVGSVSGDLPNQDTTTVDTLDTAANGVTAAQVGSFDPNVNNWIDMASYDYNSYVTDNCDASATAAAANDVDSSTMTDGESYENQYSKYYSKYYDGGNGDSGYDNNFDNNGGSNANAIICECTKLATLDNTQSLNNIDFNKCINDKFGNNGQSWDHKWLEKYVSSKDSNTVVGNNNALNDGLSNINNQEQEPITHSEYMRVIASILVCCGVLILLCIGLKCFEQAYKSYRLRNYEDIDNSQQKKNKINKNKNQNKLKRIRLPRSLNPKKNKILKKHNKNVIYTIGNIDDSQDNQYNNNHSDCDVLLV